MPCVFVNIDVSTFNLLEFSEICIKTPAKKIGCTRRDKGFTKEDRAVPRLTGMTNGFTLAVGVSQLTVE